jgi:hypothetical protein
MFRREHVRIHLIFISFLSILFAAMPARANLNAEQIMAEKIKRQIEALNGNKRDCKDDRIISENTDAPAVMTPPAGLTTASCTRTNTPQMREALLKLGQAIVDGFSPNYRYVDWTSLGNNPLFHSHYDWHSSVHAHWALLVVGRLTGNRQLTELVRSRLSDEHLRGLREELQRDHGTEMPYGRAWLVLLLDELKLAESSAPKKAFLNSFQDEVAGDVIGALNRTNAENSSGAHDSWFVSTVLLSRSKGMSRERKAQLQQFIGSRGPQLNALLQPQQIDAWNFTNPSALASIALNSRHPAHVNMQEVDLANPSEGSGHPIGAYLTKSWSLAREARTNPAACTEYVEGMNRFLRKPEYWAENFNENAHWTPQFAVMSLWMLQGER